MSRNEENRNWDGELGQVRSRAGEALVVRDDGQLWRETHGDVVARVPIGASRAKTLLQDGESSYNAELLNYREDIMPLPAYVRWVWEHVLSKRNTEVGVMHAADGKHGFGMVVPEQEVSGGSVEFDDKRAAEQLLQHGYMRGWGSIHKHPGNGQPHFSPTDEKSWEKSPGYHVIVSADGKLATQYIVAEGYVFDVGRITLPKQGARPQYFATSGGRSLDELIRMAQPRIVVQRHGVRPPASEWVRSWDKGELVHWMDEILHGRDSSGTGNRVKIKIPASGYNLPDVGVQGRHLLRQVAALPKEDLFTILSPHGQSFAVHISKLTAPLYEGLLNEGFVVLQPQFQLRGV